jgi:quercetin dioxygenase-like cupin family protein
MLTRGTSAKRGRDADNTTPMRTTFLARGSASSIHQHQEHAAWFHIVSGEIVEDRWTPDAEGGFIHERRRLCAGQSMAAPANTLHRIRSLDDAVFVTTCLCDCLRSIPARACEIDAMLKLTRTGPDRAWACETAQGDPSPDIEG